MLHAGHFDELRLNGYTVVKDVLTSDECEQTIGQYKDWLSQFKDGDWPHSVNSLIQRYNVGNMEPTWFVRLKSKKVFAQVWGTDKLLSSVDAIAIGRPPEDGKESFHTPGEHWLHLDQSSLREGLHAYQGAVYLEEAEADDWTLHVLESSHRYFKDFYDNNFRAAERSATNGYYSLSDEEAQRMVKDGFNLRRVAVPKGGMVLWDSRLVHANAKPLKCREHPGRWRYVVFVSMTPAIWASSEDLKKKKEAYSTVAMTTHWSSQGIGFFKTTIPSYAKKDVKQQTVLPEIAQTREAKLLSGVIQYNFEDGQPNGDEQIPKWKTGYTPMVYEKKSTFGMKLGVIVAVCAILSYLIFKRFR